MALRATIASFVSFLVAKLIGLPQGYWAVITALLIMQASLGGSIKAALDRLAGTLAGAAYGALVSMLIPHTGPIALAGAIAAAVGPMALLGALETSFRVAPVTALIVLLPTPGNTAPPLLYALDRVLEIGLGTIVGLTVALFILPARAHALLRGAGARVIALNADLMTALIEGLGSDAGRPGLPAIHARIRAALKQAEAAAEEAARERRSHVTDIHDPEPLVRNLYRVRHDLVMIGRAAAKPFPRQLSASLLPSLGALRDSAVALLQDLAKSLESAGPAPSPDRFDDSVKRFAAAVDSAFQEQNPGEEAGRLFALRFSFEQLAQDLADLGQRIDEITRSRDGDPS
ncbi:MAG: FUSC family protein [Hyphomicrobiales bacterium]